MVCSIISALLLVLVVGIRTPSFFLDGSEILFHRKFSGGYLRGGGVDKLSTPSVRRIIECASLCLAARPQCQSFNVRPSIPTGNEERGVESVDCEVLQKVPQSLTENTTDNFMLEEGSNYYEIVYKVIQSQTMMSCTALSKPCPQPQETGICWKNVQRTKGGIFNVTYCLEPHSEKLTWDEARAVCAMAGGQLAEPRTKWRQASISLIGMDIINTNHYSQLDTVVWIGGQGNYTGQGDKSKNKLWLWQDDTPIGQSSLNYFYIDDPNEPDDRDCIAIRHYSISKQELWVDKSCNTKAVFVCEFYHYERL